MHGGMLASRGVRGPLPALQQTEPSVVKEGWMLKRSHESQLRDGKLLYFLQKPPMMDGLMKQAPKGCIFLERSDVAYRGQSGSKWVLRIASGSSKYNKYYICTNSESLSREWFEALMECVRGYAVGKLGGFISSPSEPKSEIGATISPGKGSQLDNCDSMQCVVMMREGKRKHARRRLLKIIGRDLRFRRLGTEAMDVSLHISHGSSGQVSLVDDTDAVGTEALKVSISDHTQSQTLFMKPLNPALTSWLHSTLEELLHDNGSSEDHTFDDTSSTVTAPPPPPRLGSSITLGGSSEAHVKHLVNATFEACFASDDFEEYQDETASLLRCLDRFLEKFLESIDMLVLERLEGRSRSLSVLRTTVQCYLRQALDTLEGFWSQRSVEDSVQALKVIAWAAGWDDRIDQNLREDVSFEVLASLRFSDTRCLSTMVSEYVVQATDKVTVLVGNVVLQLDVAEVEEVASKHVRLAGAADIFSILQQHIEAGGVGGAPVVFAAAKALTPQLLQFQDGVRGLLSSGTHELSWCCAAANTSMFWASLADELFDLLADVSPSSESLETIHDDVLMGFHKLGIDSVASGIELMMGDVYPLFTSLFSNIKESGCSAFPVVVATLEDYWDEMKSLLQSNFMRESVRQSLEIVLEHYLRTLLVEEHNQSDIWGDVVSQDVKLMVDTFSKYLKRSDVSERVSALEKCALVLDLDVSMAVVSFQSLLDMYDVNALVIDRILRLRQDCPKSVREQVYQDCVEVEMKAAMTVNSLPLSSVPKRKIRIFAPIVPLLPQVKYSVPNVFSFLKKKGTDNVATTSTGQEGLHKPRNLWGRALTGIGLSDRQKAVGSAVLSDENGTGAPGNSSSSSDVDVPAMMSLDDLLSGNAGGVPIAELLGIAPANRTVDDLSVINEMIVELKFFRSLAEPGRVGLAKVMQLEEHAPGVLFSRGDIPGVSCPPLFYVIYSGNVEVVVSHSLAASFCFAVSFSAVLTGCTVEVFENENNRVQDLTTRCFAECTGALPNCVAYPSVKSAAALRLLRKDGVRLDVEIRCTEEGVGDLMGKIKELKDSADLTVMLKEYADSLELEALKGADIGMTISSNPQSRDASEDEVVAATLQPGDSFGELALLTEAPRNATIRMTTPCQLLTIGKADFETVIMGRNQEDDEGHQRPRAASMRRLTEAGSPGRSRSPGI